MLPSPRDGHTLRLEVEGDGIHAESLIGWGGPIIEDMSEMGVTACADDLRSLHAVGVVFAVNDAVFPNGLEETWPAARAGKLCIGAEQLVSADSTVVRSLYLRIPVLSGEWAFSCLLTRNRIQVRRKDLPPFGVGNIEMFRVGIGVIGIIFVTSLCLKHLRVGV